MTPVHEIHITIQSHYGKTLSSDDIKAAYAAADELLKEPYQQIRIKEIENANVILTEQVPTV
jgi:hypothetical protein